MNSTHENLLDANFRILPVEEEQTGEHQPVKQQSTTLGDFAKVLRKDVDAKSIYDVGLVVSEDGDFRIPKAVPNKVLKAYEDYFHMGANRSLSRLAQNYRDLAEQNGKHTVPCLSFVTLSKWAKKYSWELQVRHDELALREQVRSSRKDDAKELVTRTMRNLKIIESIGMKAMREFIDENGNLTERGKKELSPTEARRLVVDAAKMQHTMFNNSPEVLADEEETF